MIMSFLGINIDTVRLILTLTPERLCEIKAETASWLTKETTSLKDIQSLIGKLSFAATTVRSGRLFYSRILNFLRTLPKHGIRVIPGEVKKDISGGLLSWMSTMGFHSFMS